MTILLDIRFHIRFKTEKEAKECLDDLEALLDKQGWDWELFDRDIDEE